jgi:flagellar hook-associated protein 2
MSTISFTGLGSGLEVSEIVEALVAAESTPYESRLSAKSTNLTTDISAVGALKSALEVVQVSMESLADADNYQQRNVSGNDDFVSLSSDETAAVGSYSIEVNALATEHKLSSSGFVSADPVGEGTLSFNSGSNSFDIAVSDTNTLSEIRDAINDSTDNESIVATIITGDDGQHLVLSTKETGVENAISIVVDDLSDGNNTDNVGLSMLAYQPDSLDPNFATNMTEVTAASDAQVTIDGTLVATSASNSFTDVIDGIDITVNKVHDIDDDISIASVTENNSNIESGLNSFVSSYNTLLELADNLGGVGDDGVGVMTGDSLLRGLMGKLRAKISESFDTGNGGSLSLSALGVTGDVNGVLSLDTDTLNSFVDSDVDGVQQFLVGSDSSAGFAKSMDELMNFYTASDGLIEGRIDSKETQLDKLQDDSESFALKMEALEARLLSQFNAMDLLVANLNSTSSYLQAQLDNMPGVVSSDN